MSSTTWKWIVTYEDGKTEIIESTDDLYEMAGKIDEFHGIVAIVRGDFI